MLTISTFNIQNTFNDYSKNKSNEIYKYLKDNNIDILNLQEVFAGCEKNIKKLLEKKYTINGKYRYRFKKLPFSEKVPIITNKKVLETKTYNLPHFPAFLNRIVTRILIEEDGEKIVILNTHLDCMYDKVKNKQLNKIIEIIINEKYPVILTGDFNLKPDNPVFKEFTHKLKKLGMQLVPIDKRTFKLSRFRTPIDYVFYSDDFKLIDKKVITDLKISDHYPILVKLELKKK